MTKENNQGMKDKFLKKADKRYSGGSPMEDEEIADYWLNEISLLKKGIEEELEKKLEYAKYSQNIHASNAFEEILEVLRKAGE